MPAVQPCCQHSICPGCCMQRRHSPTHLYYARHDTQHGHPSGLHKRAKGSPLGAALEESNGGSIEQGCRQAGRQAGVAGTQLALLGSDTVVPASVHSVAHILRHTPICPTCIHQPGAQHPAQAGGPADHVALPHILVEESIGSAAQGGHMAPWDGLGLACTAREVYSSMWQQDVAAAACGMHPVCTLQMWMKRAAWWSARNACASPPACLLCRRRRGCGRCRCCLPRGPVRLQAAGRCLGTAAS